MTLYAGADPGLKGSMALLSERGLLIHLLTTPTKPTGPKGRAEYDVDRIAQRLAGWATFAASNGTELHLTVEKLRGLPPEFGPAHARIRTGFQANVARGEARGWLWMVAALRACGHRITVEAVEPMTWHRELLTGFMPQASHKERSVAMAKGLWPEAVMQRTRRSTLDDDGHAEALLLAELGRRRAAGGAVFAGRAR